MAFKSGVILDSTLPAAQSSAINNVTNVANLLTNKDAPTSAERTLTQIRIIYTNFNANNNARAEFNKKFFVNPFGLHVEFGTTCGSKQIF